MADIQRPSVNIASEEEEESQNEWMTTFSDLSMLLLVFFILLFSMSTLDAKKYTESFNSVREVFGGKDKNLKSSPLRNDDMVLLDNVRLQKQLIEAQKKTYTDIRTFLNKKGQEGIIGAIFDEGIVTLRLDADALFENGEVELTPEAKKALQTVQEILLQSKDQDVNIKGYTDDTQPLPGGRFKDNWEISSLRAVNVLRYLLDAGIDSNRLTATGLASLNPVLPNITDENRAKNRRVEFVLERKVGK